MFLVADAFDHVVNSEHLHVLEGVGIHLPWWFSKFVLLEWIAFGLICAIFIPLANRMQSGEPVRGWGWNAFEVLLTFIRERVAKPAPSLAEFIAGIAVRVQVVGGDAIVVLFVAGASLHLFQTEDVATRPV